MNAVTASAPPVLALKNIHKAFGGVVAVRDFSLDLLPGEITALVGDNGAGKSTLVKIISGIHKPSSGLMKIDGAPAAFGDASMSRARGIEAVHQDLALAAQQPVYMNMFLGREPVKTPLRLLDRKKMIRESQILIKDLDIRIPSVKASVRSLSGGQRQGVAIARATHWAKKMILLDEPTAALGVAETAKVEKIISGLRDRNLAVLIISHSLDQVFRLSDRICVLRRGAQIGVRETSKTGKNEIVSMITGVD